MVAMYSLPRRSRAGDLSLACTLLAIRLFSSSAVRWVKVQATIPSGSMPSTSRSATRWETTSVLPEPAAA